jgi:predicted helicase
MSRYETSMIKKIKYKLLIYKTLFDTLIENALKMQVELLVIFLSVTFIDFITFSTLDLSLS